MSRNPTKPISRLSDLLTERNALELELLRVHAEIDALLGASAVVVREAAARGSGFEAPERPWPMPRRMGEYLEHFHEQGKQNGQRTAGQH